MEVSDLSEENELDTYMSREVPFPKVDEAQSLIQEELGQRPRTSLWFNHGSPYTTSVFSKDTEREEHKSEYDFEKTVEGCEDPECRDHAVILYEGLSNTKKSTREERLIHLSIWIRNDSIMN